MGLSLNKDFRPGCWTPIDRRLSRFYSLNVPANSLLSSSYHNKNRGIANHELTGISWRQTSHTTQDWYVLQHSRVSPGTVLYWPCLKTDPVGQILSPSVVFVYNCWKSVFHLLHKNYECYNIGWKLVGKVLLIRPFWIQDRLFKMILTRVISAWKSIINIKQYKYEKKYRNCWIFPDLPIW